MVAKLLSTKLLRAAWREGLSQKVAVYVDASPPIMLKSLIFLN